MNSFGDTLKTGVALPAHGKTIPIVQHELQKAKPLRYKEGTSINLQFLDVEQGLGGSYVQTILEDRKGNLWFGTDQGASRYDGQYFLNFSKTAGLDFSMVNSILEDKNGNIWFGTYSVGLIRYDGESFTYFTRKDGFSGARMLTMLDINPEIYGFPKRIR